jgi:beta-glucosidase
MIQKIFMAVGFLTIYNTYSQDTNKIYTNNVGIASLTGAVLTPYLIYKYINLPSLPEISVQDFSTTQGNFGKNFSWGISTSSTQNEENNGLNTWSKDYIQEKTGKNYLQTPDFACESFTHWQDDIDKVKYLGCNSYRFSIEWSRIQPTEDTFDAAAIEHYVTMAKYCIKNGITPMVCLHHYSDPIWFMDKGGFSKEENLEKFETYCITMYEALKEFVGQWIVISQPVAYAVKSYKVGMMPPFLKNSGLEDIVMLNMFKAHVHVYDTMHTSYNQNKQGLQPEVGICHQIVQMKANTWYNPFDQLVAHFADRLYNQTLLRFFTNGNFESLIPMKKIAHEPQARGKFDFFALSYYSPLSFTGTKAGAPDCSPDLACPDSFRIIDKEGMYDAIVEAAKFGKPIYVVENGISPKDENQRKLFLDSSLSAIAKAIRKGYKVLGYSYWTLMDDYEWTDPKLEENEVSPPSRFGLFKNRVVNKKTGELDPKFTNHDTMIKSGGLHYKNIIKNNKNRNNKQ